MKMTRLIDRLEKYMEFKGINNNQMTVSAGLSNGLIGAARKKRSTLNSDNIEKILHTYRDLNPTWLITGKGDMILKKTADSPQWVNDPQLDYGTTCPRCEEKQHRINEMQDTIEILKKQLSESEKDRAIIRELLSKK